MGLLKSLLNEAIQLLTKFGPPRDWDFLELADCYRLEGIAHLKLDHNLLGPQQLGLAQGHYRDLIRSLRQRWRALFKWMLRERRFSGHRVAEPEARAKQGLANVNHLIKLNNERPDVLIASLRRGRGIPRRNRKAAALATRPLNRLPTIVWSIASWNPRSAARRNSM
jgi:hypothetical protein